MKPDAGLIQRINWMLSLFENDSGSRETDYRSVYIYKDGKGGRKQVTLGRGFTQDGGNLGRVLERYIAKKGARAGEVAPYRTRMTSADLWQDRAFLKLLGDLAPDVAMREAQDEIYLAAYLQPAFAWCDGEGFELPLSYAVAADSFLHSGGMSPKVRAAFGERTPIHGGDEGKWMREYCKARMEWFERASGALHTCVFRPLFFLRQMALQNWSFACPMSIPGKGEICG